MKYYLIVGEASGDLHASHLMAALKAEDPQADFRFFGGDLMAAVGGTMVKHYKELAYMGFIPVLLHLRTIFANMKRKKKDCRRLETIGCRACLGRLAVGTCPNPFFELYGTQLVDFLRMPGWNISIKPTE